jgi:soluble lytic murein transglycosylase
VATELRAPPARARRVRRALIALAALGVLAGAWYAVHQAMPGWYARLWYPLQYDAIIRAEAARYHLDPALVAAVIYRESGFVPDSRSERGAVGLMQLLPETARFMAQQPRRPSPAPDDLERPEVNIAYGSRYLRYLIDRHGSVPLALAAYNAGEANLAAWLRQARQSGRSLRVPDDIPFSETRTFVREVGDTTAIYRRAYRTELGAG